MACPLLLRLDFSCLSIMVLLSLMTSGDPAPGRELFRSEVREGVSLVISQETMVPAEALKISAVQPADDEAGGIRTTGYFTLGADLVTESGTLRIWSRVQPVEYDGQWESYEVLDVLELPEGRLIVVIVGGFSAVEVIDIPVIRPPRRTVLQGHDWSQVAAAALLKPGRVSAKLNYDEGPGIVGLVVTDHIGSPAVSTRFEQKQDEWEFSRIE